MGSHYDEDAPIRPKALQELFEQEKDGRSPAELEVALRRRMLEACDQGTNLITAGQDGEQVIFNKTHGGILFRRLPDDPDRVLRVSIGMPEWDTNQAYLIFRGDPAKVFDLLRRSYKQIQKMMPLIQNAAKGEG
jgi:hypothetical protein